MQQRTKQLVDQVLEACQLKHYWMGSVPGCCFPPPFAGEYSAFAQPVGREHREPVTWRPTCRKVGSYPWPEPVEGTTGLSLAGRR